MRDQRSISATTRADDAAAAHATATDALDHLTRMLGADHVTAPDRPLTIVLGDPQAARSPFTAHSTNSIHFDSSGALGYAERDADVVMHEIMHIATNRLVPPPAQFAPPFDVLDLGRGTQDAAVREALSDVAGAIHAKSWVVGAEAAGITRDLSAATRLERSSRLTALKALQGYARFDIHTGGAPVTSAFHAARDLGWNRLEQLLGTTVNQLAKTPDRRLTFSGTLDALEAAKALLPRV